MQMAVKTDFIQDFLIVDSYRIYRYLLLVGMLFGTSIVIAYSAPEEYVNLRQRMWIALLDFILLGCAIWVNIHWSVKRFLLQNQFMSYLIFVAFTVGLVLLGVAVIQLNIYDLDMAVSQMLTIRLILNLFSSMLTISFFLCGVSTIVILKHWIFPHARRSELESATLQTELNNLKSQINPHFLFNMLNNAHVLIKKNREEAARILFKLENLLRYQMNDSFKECVNLSSDIRFLNDFLNLEQIRRDRFDYRITKEGDIHQVSLPPLLFIPFVENAVKHSQDSEAGSYVYLTFKVEPDEVLFVCRNSRPEKEIRKGRSSGVGLKNIVRRLVLLYPGKHELSIIEEPDSYTVRLALTI